MPRDIQGKTKKRHILIESRQRVERFVRDKNAATDFSIAPQTVLLHPDRMLHRQTMQHQTITMHIALRRLDGLALAAYKARINMHVVQQTHDISGKSRFILVTGGNAMGKQWRMPRQLLGLGGTNGQHVITQFDALPRKGEQISHARGRRTHHQFDAPVQHQFIMTGIRALNVVNAQSLFGSQPRQQPGKFLQQ